MRGGHRTDREGPEPQRQLWACVSAEGRRSHPAVITSGETQRMIRPRRHCSQTHGLLGKAKGTQGENDQEKGSPSGCGPRSCTGKL